MKNTQITIIVVLAAALVLLLGFAFLLDNPLPSAHQPTEPSDTAPASTPEPEPTWTSIPADRVLTAAQAFVYDCATDEYLHLTGDAADEIYPGSLTKLFTAYAALQHLPGAGTVTVGDEFAMASYSDSLAGLKKGDVLTVDQLIEAMMLPDGDDAAYVLAVAAGRAIAGENVSPAAAAGMFMQEMNQLAKSHGMDGTSFATPDGYHAENHCTTMGDLTRIATLALNTPSIRRSAALVSDTITAGNRELKWRNSNALIDPESPYYCPIAFGLKAGENCLLSAFDLEGRTVIIGVFGCAEGECFADTLQLLQRVTDADQK